MSSHAHATVPYPSTSPSSLSETHFAEPSSSSSATSAPAITFEDEEDDSVLLPDPAPIPSTYEILQDLAKDVFSSETLMNDLRGPKSVGGLPTLEDLEDLRPRHTRIPHASDSKAHQILYAKAWDAAQAMLEAAFTRAQLLHLVGPDVLAIKGNDRLLLENYRTPAGKRIKAFARSLSKFSKRELIKVIMVARWEMVDPTALAVMAKTAVSENVFLDEKTVFLLMSPSSPVAARLNDRLGVKMQLQRHHSGKILAHLRGGQAAVSDAKEDLSTVLDISPQMEFELPEPASQLPAQVYQAISKQANIFLEPTEDANVILGTAVDDDCLDRAKRLLRKAFVHNASHRTTPVFFSHPADKSTSPYYAFYPFAPNVPAPWAEGATTSYARVKSLSTASSHTSPLVSPPIEGDDPTAASASIPSQTSSITRLGSSEQTDALDLLFRPFVEKGTAENVKLSASFGTVLWPLYPDQAAGGHVLGPVMNGEVTAEDFADWWKEKLRPSVFIPSPPPNFLASTGVLARAPPTGDQIISIWEAKQETIPTPAPAAETPSVEVDFFRRITYRSFGTSRDGAATTTVNFEVRAGAVHVQKVESNSVKMMLPHASCDLELTASVTTDLAAATVSNFRVEEPAATITVDNMSFILDSDCRIQHTTIVSPATSTTSSTTRIQERWEDSLFDGARGAGVSVVLGEGKATEDWSERWQKGVREVEEAAAARYRIVDAGIDISAANRVFASGGAE